MKEHKFPRTSESENIPVNGVSVMRIREGDGKILQGNIEYTLKHYSLADEFMSRAVYRLMEKQGDKPTIIFHPDSWMAEDARKYAK